MHGKSVIIWLVVILCFVATSAQTDDTGRKEGEIGKETGELELNKVQYRSFIDGKLTYLPVKKVDKNRYSALNSLIDIFIPPPPINCWVLFHQYYTSHLAQFQAWANKLCRPYISCWSCPNSGLFITFFVNPTVLCPIIANPASAKRIPVYEA